MISLSRSVLKTISTLCFLVLVAIPFSHAEAKNHWSDVFARHFQPNRKISKAFRFMRPPVARAARAPKLQASTFAPTVLNSKEASLVKEASTFEVEFKPVIKKEVVKTPEIKAKPEKVVKTIKGPFRRFKKVAKKQPVLDFKTSADLEQKPATVRGKKLTRYTDFVVPERLVTSLFAKLKTEHSTSKIVTPQELQRVTHKVTNSQLRAQGIRELIGVGLSNFDHSSPNRKHNIYNAIQKFDGLIIPKGEEFSFNAHLKNAGPSNGFLMAKIISRGMTKYGWGGGVCQVSTTVFRSAYNSGLPIVARRNHTFKVPYYGQLPEEQGMDATIYLGGQDLKFSNDTPGDIMMQFVEKDDNLMVLFYGTKDRKVAVNGPEIQGLSYEWNRVVSFPDGDKWDEVLKSKYQREIMPVVEKEGDEAQARNEDGVN